MQRPDQKYLDTRYHAPIPPFPRDRDGVLRVSSRTRLRIHAWVNKLEKVLRLPISSRRESRNWED